MAEASTYGLEPQKLAELIAACAGAKRWGKPDSTPKQLFDELFCGEVVLDTTDPESIPAVLKRPCDEMLAVAGHSILDLILAPSADIAILKCLKDYGKAFVRRAPGEAENTVATMLYYAAIAAALVRHERKITSLSYESMVQSFAELGEKPWLPQELKALLRAAGNACRRKISAT